MAGYRLNIPTLIVRNIQANSFRSWVIFLCTAVLAGLAVAATLFVTGAQESLRLATSRLGADMIVVPASTAPMMEHAFLMGTPTSFWMPGANLDEVRGVPGVAAASPQLYLSTLRGATCCSVPEMFLIAFDPATDFTLTPWLKENADVNVGLNEAVGGHFVYIPSGQDRILIYGSQISLKTNLEATGTGLDQSMFFTFDTAYAIARESVDHAERPMEIPEGSVSSILVRLSEGSSPADVAAQIRQRLPEVSVVESSNLFRSQREHLSSLLRSIVFLLVITWLLSTSLIGIVFSMTINDRRREIGVMRALGATRPSIFSSLLGEAAALAIAGGISGVALTTFVIYLFKNLIVSSTELPFLMPEPLTLLGWTAAGLILVLVSVAISALFPALRISWMDPAVAMRE